VSHRLLPPALAALALAPAALAAPAPSVADEPVPPEPELVESCTTTTLTDAEIAAGERNEITCTWVDQTQMRSQMSRLSRSGPIAIHHSGSSGGGSYLNVFGSCVGGISFPNGDPWNDRISSTTHYTCGTIKHFANVDYTLGPETSNGSYGLTWDLSAYTDDQVSSIAYGN
jgi:hypothetical protein